MLADGTAELAREVARHRGAVALDDDVEVGGRPVPLAPEVADHSADQERVRPPRGRAPSDRREQRSCVGGKPPGQTRRGGNVGHRGGPGQLD